MQYTLSSETRPSHLYRERSSTDVKASVCTLRHRRGSERYQWAQLLMMTASYLAIPFGWSGKGK
jgi:hypothetical protein